MQRPAGTPNRVMRGGGAAAGLPDHHDSRPVDYIFGKTDYASVTDVAVVIRAVEHDGHTWGLIARRLDDGFVLLRRARAAATRTSVPLVAVAVPVIAGYEYILLRGSLLQAMARIVVMVVLLLLVTRRGRPRRADGASPKLAGWIPTRTLPAPAIGTPRLGRPRSVGPLSGRPLPGSPPSGRTPS